MKDITYTSDFKTKPLPSSTKGALQLVYFICIPLNYGIFKRNMKGLFIALTLAYVGIKAFAERLLQTTDLFGLPSMNISDGALRV